MQGIRAQLAAMAREEEADRRREEARHREARERLEAVVAGCRGFAREQDERQR
jgi:hypothetical protein